MAFEFLKKGLAGLGKSNKSTDDAPAKKQESAKKSLAGASFAEGESNLIPDENKKDGATDKTAKPKEKKDTRSFGAKVDDYLGLGSRLQTKEWCQRKWKEAEGEIAFQKIDGMLEKYRTPMMAFLKKEWSTENANALLALKAGMPMKDFYHRFMSDESPEQVNLGKEKVHKDLATDGKYDDIDRNYVQKGLYTNLSDSFSRAMLDPSLLKAVFQRMTNMTPPDKVGGGYNDK